MALNVNLFMLGSSVSFNGPAARYFAFASYRRLAGWLTAPAEPNTLAMGFTGISSVATVGLLFLRTRLLCGPSTRSATRSPTGGR